MKEEPLIRREVDPRELVIPVNGVSLLGELSVPAAANGIVLFAHGSGSSRHSPRNQYVARVIREAGIGTLVFDLLTRSEEAIDARTRHLRFDIERLARRLVDATRFIQAQPETRDLRVGYFGASTGAGAALMAAAELNQYVGAVVSRGGRPDMAGAALPHVIAPTLLIVGGLDGLVIKINQEAYEQLRCEKRLEIVPDATHLFEEPGKLELVAQLAAAWFREHFSKRGLAAIAQMVA